MIYAIPWPHDGFKNAEVLVEAENPAHAIWLAIVFLKADHFNATALGALRTDLVREESLPYITFGCDD